MTSSNRSLLPAREPPHSQEHIVAVAPALEQLASLRALEEKNRAAEGKLSLSMRVRLGGIMGGGGLFVAGAAASLPVLQTGGFVVAAAAFLGGLLLSRQGRQLDLDDRKLHAARYVIDALREDLSPDRPVRLDLDFEGYDRTAPLAGEEVLQYGPDKVFLKRWLGLGLTLLDGTRVEVEATTRARRRSRRKSRYTKLTDSVRDDVVVTLRPASGASFDPSAAEATRARFQGRERLSLRGATLSDDRAELRFRLGPGRWRRLRYGWHPDQDIGSLLDGHKLLELVLASYAIARGDRFEA